VSNGNRKSSDDGEAGFDSSRAELFDALGHPTRIKILQVLNQRAMTFSELKKEVGIESSGHLSFHLGKLNLLLRVTPEGVYELTDDGREALHLAEVMSQTGSPSTAANSIQSGRDSKKKGALLAMNPKRKKILIAVLAVLIIAVLLVGIGLSNSFIFYSSQEMMNWGYQTPTNPPQYTAWQTITFNDTQGKLLSDFNFNVGGLPAQANATEQTIELNIQIAHTAGTFLDSLRLGFVASNPSSCGCFLLEEVASLGIGGFPPVSSQMYYENGVTTFNVQNFGYIGVASVTLGFLLALSRPSNLAILPSGNNSLVLNIELKMHATNKVLIGQNYVGDASASLNIMPNGLIALANP
jgi:DNA-binding transcriptional ArsR family regulator